MIILDSTITEIEGQHLSEWIKELGCESGVRTAFGLEKEYKVLNFLRT